MATGVSALAVASVRSTWSEPYPRDAVVLIILRHIRPRSVDRLVAMQHELVGVGPFSVETRRDGPKHHAARLRRECSLQLLRGADVILGACLLGGCPAPCTRFQAIQSQGGPCCAQGLHDEGIAVTFEVLHRIGCHRASPSREEGVPSDDSFIIWVGVAQPLNRQTRLFLRLVQRRPYTGYENDNSTTSEARWKR